MQASPGGLRTHVGRTMRRSDVFYILGGCLITAMVTFTIVWVYGNWRTE